MLLLQGQLDFLVQPVGTAGHLFAGPALALDQFPGRRQLFANPQDLSVTFGVFCKQFLFLHLQSEQLRSHGIARQSGEPPGAGRHMGCRQDPQLLLEDLHFRFGGGLGRGRLGQVLLQLVEPINQTLALEFRRHQAGLAPGQTQSLFGLAQFLAQAGCLLRHEPDRTGSAMDVNVSLLVKVEQSAHHGLTDFRLGPS